ncbi:MAG: tetratricopeptide repeat protein [Bacteroidales bacterium]|nr:tetratricopeptide repeat protein [Bacteroidales bacterium]
MSKKKKQTTGTGFETVEHALSRTEQYIEENKKSLMIIVGVIVALVGGYLLWKKYILEPKETEAQSQMYLTEQNWNSQNYDLVINGDGDKPGALEIIDQYGITNTENLAQFMTGISYLRTGQYEKAIEHLEKFDSDDYLVSTLALGAIGDAYVQLSKYEDAVDYYEDAVDEHPNNLTSPIFLKKAGLAYLALKDKESALECFRRIRSEFPNSSAAVDINKYIEVAKRK